MNDKDIKSMETSWSGYEMLLEVTTEDNEEYAIWFTPEQLAFIESNILSRKDFLIEEAGYPSIIQHVTNTKETPVYGKKQSGVLGGGASNNMSGKSQRVEFPRYSDFKKLEKRVAALEGKV